MTLKFLVIDLPRILVCTVALLALSACSNGSSGGDSEPAPQSPSAPDDSAAGPNTPPAGAPGTPQGDAPGDTPVAPAGDTPSDDTPVGATAGDNAQLLGIVSFSQTGGQPASSGITSIFYKISGGFPFANASSELQPAEDTCTVSTADSSDNDDIPGSDSTEFVSAGEVITVSSPAGFYAELVEHTESGFSVYLPSVEELTTPFPADLTVDIPGNVFPAFANVAVPNVEPLVMTDSSEVNGSYNWVAGNNPDARVYILQVGFNSDSTDTIGVHCIAIDDGEFSIPASISSQLPADVSGTTTYIYRSATTFLQSGNAILLVTNSSGE